MNRGLQRRVVVALVLPVLLFIAAPALRAQNPFGNTAVTRSASGQFVVSASAEVSPLFRRPDFSGNTNILALQAPWLVVSAERFRTVLWRELGISPNASWRGKIFITLHPARTLDEEVVIAPRPFVQVWDCALELPDLLDRNRYARAMSAVVLLELANRGTPVTARPAELPAWLVDGLAREVAESDEVQAILSAPTKSVNGIAETRLDRKQRGLDPLAVTRHALQQSSALSFDQMSWPTDTQMDDRDGGVYFASAQLFLHELLDLKNGPAKMRTFISQLVNYQNWQSAFFSAFRENFRTPLEVEKWWSLRVIDFIARDPGPRWTVAVSRQNLDAVLTVPVGVRYASNSLPQRADISLQRTVQSFSGEQRTVILQNKLRDLELTQLRLAAPLAPLADGYRRALAEFLGYRTGQNGVLVAPRRVSHFQSRGSLKKLLQTLDALDARRQTVEAGLDKRALPVPTP